MKIHHILQLLVDTVSLLLMFLTTMNAVNETNLNHLLMPLVPFIFSLGHLLIYEKECYPYIMINLVNYSIGSICSIMWFILDFQVKYRERFYDSYMFIAFIYYIHWIIEVIYHLKKK
jgi:hypothetical protein